MHRDVTEPPGKQGWPQRGPSQNVNKLCEYVKSYKTKKRESDSAPVKSRSNSTGDTRDILMENQHKAKKNAG